MPGRGHVAGIAASSRRVDEWIHENGCERGDGRIAEVGVGDKAEQRCETGVGVGDAAGVLVPEQWSVAVTAAGVDVDASASAGADVVAVGSAIRPT